MERDTILTGLAIMGIIAVFFVIIIGFGLFIESIEDARALRMTKACKEYGLVWKERGCQ